MVGRWWRGEVGSAGGKGAGGRWRSSLASFPVTTPARGARARGEERRSFQREWNEEVQGVIIEAAGGAGKGRASQIPEVGISSPWKENFL